MRFPGAPRLGPFALALSVLASATFRFALSPTVRAECGTASSAPCPPTPTPVNAFLSLDVTQGGPTTVINVSGGQFLPNESKTLYWDTPNHVAGSATADRGGSFNTGQALRGRQGGRAPVVRERAAQPVRELHIAVRDALA